MDNDAPADVAVPQQGPEAPKEGEDQFVSFTLANEEYGIPILRVQEIIRHSEPTRVPRTPDFVEGVLNLRGQVIPVIDLRRRFGLPAGERNRDTRIIVVEAGNQTIGMVVDGVSAVVPIGRRQIEPPPPMGAQVRTDFIVGMGKVEDRLIILLDIDRILTAPEKSAIDELPTG